MFASAIYYIHPISAIQSILNGMTRINAGIKSTSGPDLMRDTRKPAAIVRMPPQAERSANIVGGSTLESPRPARKTISRITPCGSGIAQIAAPNGDQFCRAEQRRCAGNLHQLVRDNISKDVVRHNHVERPRLTDYLHACRIHIAMAQRHIGVFARHNRDRLDEFQLIVHISLAYADREILDVDFS